MLALRHAWRPDQHPSPGSKACPVHLARQYDSAPVCAFCGQFFSVVAQAADTELGADLMGRAAAQARPRTERPATAGAGRGSSSHSPSAAGPPQTSRSQLHSAHAAAPQQPGQWRATMREVAASLHQAHGRCRSVQSSLDRVWESHKRFAEALAARERMRRDVDATQGTPSAERGSRGSPSTYSATWPSSGERGGPQSPHSHASISGATSPSSSASTGRQQRQPDRRRAGRPLGHAASSGGEVDRGNDRGEAEAPPPQRLLRAGTIAAAFMGYRPLAPGPAVSTASTDQDLSERFRRGDIPLPPVATDDGVSCRRSRDQGALAVPMAPQWAAEIRSWEGAVTGAWSEGFDVAATAASDGEEEVEEVEEGDGARSEQEGEASDEAGEGTHQEKGEPHEQHDEEAEEAEKAEEPAGHGAQAGPRQRRPVTRRGQAEAARRESAHSGRRGKGKGRGRRSPRQAPPGTASAPAPSLHAVRRYVASRGGEPEGYGANGDPRPLRQAIARPTRPRSARVAAGAYRRGGGARPKRATRPPPATAAATREHTRGRGHSGVPALRLPAKPNASQRPHSARIAARERQRGRGAGRESRGYRSARAVRSARDGVTRATSQRIDRERQPSTERAEPKPHAPPRQKDGRHAARPRRGLRSQSAREHRRHEVEGPAPAPTPATADAAFRASAEEEGGDRPRRHPPTPAPVPPPAPAAAPAPATARPRAAGADWAGQWRDAAELLQVSNFLQEDQVVVMVTEGRLATGGPTGEAVHRALEQREKRVHAQTGSPNTRAEWHPVAYDRARFRYRQRVAEQREGLRGRSARDAWRKRRERVSLGLDSGLGAATGSPTAARRSTRRGAEEEREGEGESSPSTSGRGLPGVVDPDTGKRVYVH